MEMLFICTVCMVIGSPGKWRWDRGHWDDEGSVRARLLRPLCVCVVGSAEEGQYDPCRIQGPTHKVLGRSGSEIQDGQLESEKGWRGAG